MANNPSDLVKFKRGTFANLQTKITNKSGEDGCFYLTIDSNIDSSRLFIGRADGSIVPVNQGIIKTTNIEDLTGNNFQAGDFAYVENGNILAVRSGTKWVQINNATDTHADDFEQTITVSNGVATITSTIGMNAGSDLSDSFNITGADGVSVSASGNAITISGDPYNLDQSVDNNTATLTLSSNSVANAGTINIIGGDNITIGEDDGDIIIEAEDTTNDHITLSSESQGFSVAIGDSSGQQDLTSTIDPTIVFDHGDSTYTTVHFVNGAATLPVYTKTEVDAITSAVRAMTYKGTVGTNGSAGSTIAAITSDSGFTAKLGDTYMVSSDLSLPSGYSSTRQVVDLRAGDLLIAQGIEDDGQITAASLRYAVVPSGNDPDTTYTVTPKEHGIGLQPSTSGSSEIGGLTLVAGTQIGLVDGDSVSTQKSITVNHATITQQTPETVAATAATTQNNQSTLTIPVLSGITLDNGHVTKLTTTNYQVTDTNAELDSFGTAVSAASNVATVTTTVGLLYSGQQAADEKSAAFKVTSDNLTITAVTPNGANAVPEVHADLTWGQF